VVCPHHPDARCDCRKPAPGLLYRLARHYRISLGEVPVVGDAERDLAAAATVGARPILVLTGKGRATRDALARRGETVETYADLGAVAQALVAECTGRAR
jgi:D-glycero-D-manno-heptose 1,7-bisphosphate phosphatase